MRILLLPRSIEHQFVKKVRQCPDAFDLMRVILAPGPGPGLSCSGGARSAVGDARDLVLAVCRGGDCDGHYGDPEVYAAGVARHVKSLCALMGLRAGIVIRIFSFMDDEHLMMATLRGCDIFYMAGIYRVSEQWAQASAQGPARRLAEEIQTRVQYNCMAFIGVCGGAKMSGSEPYYGLTPLDLLQGAAVRYDCNCATAEVLTTPQVVQITTGCAVAMYMWQDRRQGICFHCVKKNADVWWPFAEQNTRALQDFVVHKCNTPQEFSFKGKRWYFTLAGYIMYRNEDQTWREILNFS